MGREAKRLRMSADAIAKLPEATDPRGELWWDTEVRGLSLRRTPGGASTWIVFYRTVEGLQRKPRLGSYPAVSVTEARKRARATQAAVAAGADPSRERKELRRQPSMGDLFDDYLEWAAENKKASSVKKDKYLITHYIRPALGDRKVAAITPEDVEAFRDGLRGEDGKRIKTTANRCLSLLSKAFSLARKWKLYRGANPCADVERHAERKVHRHLSELDWARLGRELARYEGRLPHAVAAIRLLLVSGLRSGEVLHMRWDEIDLVNGFYHMPDTKAGRPRTVPLNKAAIDIIEGRKAAALVGNGYVFPSPSRRTPGAPLHDLDYHWGVIRTAAGLRDVRLHDCRHAFGEQGAVGGLSLPMIGRLLGHSSPSITARYSELVADQVRLASEQTAARVVAALAREVEG